MDFLENKKNGQPHDNATHLCVHAVSIGNDLFHVGKHYALPKEIAEKYKIYFSSAKESEKK